MEPGKIRVYDKPVKIKPEDTIIDFILCILWSERCYCKSSGGMVFNYFRRTNAIYK